MKNALVFRRCLLFPYFIALPMAALGDTNATPKLNILWQAPQQLSVSWPGPAFGYVLEQTARLDRSDLWRSVSNTISFTYDHYSVTLTPSDVSQFFRLKYFPTQGQPPDPSTVAPILDRRQGGDFSAGIAFLYSGQNAIQTGMSNNAIVNRQAAVIRGVVRQRGGQALAGVTVSILNHPQYGQTLTRADGRYDLAVNGGDVVTVNYAKTAYLTAQRSLRVPWQDYAQAPEVVLLPLDPASSKVVLGASAPMQVARGSVQSDRDGSRQATLILQTGATASIIQSDGSTQAVSSLTVRATEFTVGTNGPASMPAPLPPTSGYTYAVDFSADEAQAAGAQSVVFDQPIYNYVENFLDFPVGTPVPTGYYDSTKGYWVPSSNGLVIKILGVTGGLADLDITGANTAAPASALAALGCTAEERMKLASLYPVGQTLWRVPIHHFSPWDHNWPYGPPSNAVMPNQPSASDNSIKLDDPYRYKGYGTVEAQNQAFSEVLGVVGTPYRLHYSSARMPGCRANASYRIALSGASIPDSLKRIDLVIAVAGRNLTWSFPAATNQSYLFQWDGRDAYGRAVPSAQTITIRVGHVYPAVYQQPAAFRNNFGFSSGVPLTGNQGRQEVTIWQEQTSIIHPDITWSVLGANLGGWSLNVHHVYDTAGKRLYLGNGRQRQAERASRIITTIAGNGDTGFEGDGGPASKAKLESAASLVANADGSLFFVDRGNGRIRKIDPEGTISTVAGGGSRKIAEGIRALDINFLPWNMNGSPPMTFNQNGELYFGLINQIWRLSPAGVVHRVAGFGTGGMGGLAMDAKFFSIRALAAAPDGSLYVAGESRFDVGQIWKMSTDGYINKIAGSDEGGDGIVSDGNNGPATAAKICRICSLAVGHDGSIYFSETHFSSRMGDLVRRVGPDGIMRAFAGSGAYGPGGDGGPAILAQMAAEDNRNLWLALGRDDTLYIFDSDRLRVVGPDGIIYSLAGVYNKSAYPKPTGDGGPASQALFTWHDGLAVTPNGDIYIGDLHCIRKISALFPGLSKTDFYLASEDGAELYLFNAEGRHLRTLDARTFVVRHQFAYDTAARLVGITDGDGQTTVIERDAQGVPIALVSPLGQRTALTVNAQGYLSKITNPAGESISLSYVQEGLLGAVSDPLGRAFTVAYDTNGYVLKASDPAGGFTSLQRQDGTNFSQVTATSAEGRSTLHQVQNLTALKQKRLDTYPDGSQTQVTLDNDGNSDLVLRDGTRVSVSKGPDPLYGMQAPRTTTNIITLPSQLAFVRTVSRVARFDIPGDVMTFQQIFETNRINGAVFTRVYDAGARTLTNTTPSGRLAWVGFDQMGRVISNAVPGLAPAMWTYHTQGHLVQFIVGSGPDARTNRYTYDAAGRLSALVDPLNQTTRFNYEAAGRLNAKNIYDNQGGLINTVLYRYNQNGIRVAVQPPGRPEHAYGYTDTDLLAAYVAPTVPGVSNTTTLFTYNMDRQITRIQRPDGITVDYTYDAAGRVSRVRSSDGLLDTTFAYQEGTGQLLRTTTADGVETAYQYDGGLLTHLTWSGVVTGQVQWTWDTNFLVKQFTAQNQKMSLQYDSDGLLKYCDGLTIARDPEGQKNGLIKSTAYFTVSDTNTYNVFGEIASYTAFLSKVPCYAYQLNRDPLGRITRKMETIGQTTNQFDYTYDGAGRLVAVKINGVNTTTYTYDANGNRIEVARGAGPRIGTYDNQDRLVQFGDTAYSYGVCGELKAKTQAGQSTTYQYDVAGNLKQAVLKDGTTIRYAVDSQNRRVQRVKGNTITKYLYGDRLRPVAELDGNDKLVSLFTYACRGNVPDKALIQGRYCRLITDHLGSVRLVVDAQTKAILQQVDYDEFGQVLRDTHPGFQPFGFAGGLYDPDTGLVRFGVRDYDPETGRWTAQDPLGFEQPNSNLYAYCGNDPVNFKDSGGAGALALGLGVAGGAVSGGTLSFSLVVDTKGNVGVMFTGGAGVYGGAGGSVALSGGVFSAQDIYEMRGHSYVAGASGGEAISIGTETTIASTYCGQSISVGAGGGTPVEVHMFDTESAVYGFNLLHPFGTPQPWTPPPPPPSLLSIKEARQQDIIPMTSVPELLTGN